MLQDPINNSALALKGYPVKIFAYYYYYSVCLSDLFLERSLKRQAHKFLDSNSILLLV